MSMKEIIAKRAAKELQPYSVINLGIGIPTLVTNYVDTTLFYFHTENGMLGVKELEDRENFDPLLVNAGKLPVGEQEGSSFFHSADSFGMIRGGHVDTAILGALQVDEKGLIANWAVPGQNILGVGGAMDLLVGAKKVIVTTSHTTKNGDPKIVESCKYPITSTRQIDMIITELAVFEFIDNELVLTELGPEATIKEVIEKTGATFKISEALQMEVGEK
ncbi:succinyl-CoA--3-ketoacid-CoA transferase [Alkalihalophilus pseudofirmus]|uniref:3-oxoacid CoA-transferase subunit B n=1 Tax=Alkalihalobacterium alkalinitrilicum TaxID=427920 RepID=UPI00094C4BEA|nr:3-oxoacid CoA-transferase subunit B [Alkalihalobacterium alkalinitrilicum]OLO42209.1 succinyl-CoA--3-ketoacid-CoA transferase [Alkalihalophilus pseudofirmus]